MDLFYGYRIQIVPLLAAHLFRDDEMGVLEHDQMLHDTKPSEVGQHEAEFVETLPIAREECVEQGSTTGIAKGFEHVFVIHCGRL